MTTLPELPPVPDEIVIGEDADGGAMYGQDEDALRAWAIAYAELAVSSAAAAIRNAALESAPVADERAARNDLLSLAARLGEYPKNPHHVDPMSDAFRRVIADARKIVLQAAASAPVAGASQPFAVLAVHKNGGIRSYSTGQALQDAPIQDSERELQRKCGYELVTVYAAPQPCADAELRAAFNEWQDKTDFIQKRIAAGELPVKYLGWHRADVMRDLIEQPRPSDDQLWDQTLAERDEYHDIADKLANAIADHLLVEIGEHSSSNCPWMRALEAIENAAPQVSTEDVRNAALEEVAQFIDNSTFWVGPGEVRDLKSTPVADESPMAKTAEALREKARQEQQAYQDRRNQATEWGPLPEGTEADHPTPTSAPVAHVAGDEVSRYLEWAKDRSAWEMPVGTPVYYSALASSLKSE